jgi:hypothetical protein
VSGCAAEYHLSQSALRVGALDQKVATQRLSCRQDHFTRRPPIKLDGERLCHNAIALQISDQMLSGWPGTPVPPMTVSTVRRSASRISGIANAVVRVCSVLRFHAINTLVAIGRGGDSAEVPSLSASSAPASAERCAIISSRVSDERL